MKPTRIMQGKSGLIIGYGQPDIKATARIIAPRIRELLLRDLEEKKPQTETQPKKASSSI